MLQTEDIRSSVILTEEEIQAIEMSLTEHAGCPINVWTESMSNCKRLLCSHEELRRRLEDCMETLQKISKHKGTPRGCYECGEEGMNMVSEEAKICLDRIRSPKEE